ncbi:ribonuclease M5 [Alkalibaculum sp. M08DMB]|uniref:Ribonuclease M5 n=1 Tax=Alkalibaculum sporogenes TaxID=2655001 RepID=A0A6A7K8F2_9FIRM|nr:ribonuclease M5 [Alkalibaculum sporogenes]MPW25363.1 ribonuclease M5 [Alkalibaculum sporogenes]
MIKELIVVEGKDDISAVKRAVEADLVCTHGYGITKEVISVIQKAAKTRGVIVFTDPDFAGDKIRRYIVKRVPNCKHAYLPKHLGKKNNNIGIENAKPEDIIEALSKVKTIVEFNNTFELFDMFKLGLISGPLSSEKRRFVGEKLGIGYSNSKQFINRLNNYGITIDELLIAIDEYKQGV